MNRPYAYDDGGRADAGFRGDTRDCVTRAIAIATGIPYVDVYEALYDAVLSSRSEMARLELRYGARARDHVSPRTGVHRRVYQRYLADLGWEWTPTMSIGSGCTVHLRAEELYQHAFDGDPTILYGITFIARLSRHITAVVDGVIRDTYDCSRAGTRCWLPPTVKAGWAG